MSRHEVLQWVNEKINEKVPKIEALCSGVAYCQMLEQLYPNCIGAKKIKHNAKMEHEFLYNFKLLQAAFASLDIQKTVPVDRLLKGRFQDNFEFIQWFKKFYEDHADGKILTNPKKLIKSRSGSVKNLTKRSPSPSVMDSLKKQQEELELYISTVDKDRIFYYNKLTQIEEILKNSIKSDTNVEWCQRGLRILYDKNPDEDLDSAEENPVEENH